MTSPEIIRETEIHRGWLQIVRREIRHCNRGVQHYEIVNPSSHSVSVVAFDQNEDVILVELYRFGQQKRLLELPAGAVEKDESFKDAIERELLEETGYKGNVIPIGKHFIAAEHGVTRHVLFDRSQSLLTVKKHGTVRDYLDEELFEVLDHYKIALV